MVGTRDTPVDIQESTYGVEAGAVGNFENTADAPDILTPAMAKKLGVECYQSSTNWINAGRRAKWNDSLRSFQGLFPSGSKYLSSEYKYRTRLYRPKTRAMVRKSEAQTAAAFFGGTWR